MLPVTMATFLFQGSGVEYLVVWSDYPTYEASWQPSSNLTEELISNFEEPKVSEELVKLTREQLIQCFHHIVTGRSNEGGFTSVSVRLDVLRKITSKCSKVPSPAFKGYIEVTEEDFDRMNIGHKTYLNKHYYGRKLVFPVLMKPSVTWTKENFVNGRFIRYPEEKVFIRAVTDAHNNESE